MSNLYNKYRIEKADGSPVDPNADYFVLRLDKDPHALVAARAYAKSIELEDEDLAKDLIFRVMCIERRKEPKS